MRIRRLLVVLGTAIAAIIGLDALLTRLAGPLPPAIAGASDTVDTDGTTVHVVEAGPSDGDPIVFVHSPYIGASAREFAALATELAEEYRVILVDLPGFGRSTPSDGIDDSEVHADAIAAVIEEVSDEPTVIASGQSYPAALAACERTAVEQLIAIGPRTARRSPAAFTAAVLETPIIGTALHLALTSKPLLATQLAGEFEVSSGSISPDFLAYTWKSAHQPGARDSFATWLGGDLDTIDELEALAGDAAVEQAFVVGEASGSPSPESVRAAASAAGASVSLVSGCTAYPHLQAPEAIADHLRESTMLARTQPI